MKKSVEKNIKEIEKMIKKQAFYTVDEFCRQAERYIKAIKTGRMIVNIESVSKSGMSRVMKFVSCEKNKNTGNFQYYSYYSLFKALGYRQARNSNGFSISGGNMDMVFNTNYEIIHDLYRLGFINKKQCDNFAQKTPTVI